VSNGVFSDVNLKGTAFKDCQISDCDFIKTNLTEVNFDSCDLKGSTFENCELTSTSFKGSKNYSINPNKNYLKKTKFSFPEVVSLLDCFDIEIE
ncbi:pentapeptide repeat-containing protein, partial [Nanoarchaeota archaeon]